MRGVILLAASLLGAFGCVSFPEDGIFGPPKAPDRVTFRVTNAVVGDGEVLVRLGDADTVEVLGWLGGVVWSTGDIDEWTLSDAAVATVRPLPASDCRWEYSRNCAVLHLRALGTVELRVNARGTEGRLRLRVIAAPSEEATPAQSRR